MSKALPRLETRLPELREELVATAHELQALSEQWTELRAAGTFRRELDEAIDAGCRKLTRLANKIQRAESRRR